MPNCYSASFRRVRNICPAAGAMLEGGAGEQAALHAESSIRSADPGLIEIVVTIDTTNGTESSGCPRR